MRKLKLQIQLSIDGYISGPNGEMDWMCLPWTDDIIRYVREITETVDSIILGRKLAEGFIPHWETVVQDPFHTEFEGGLKFTLTPKIVFSKTLEKSIWNNTRIANGSLLEEIYSLKNQKGKDIMVYGGGSFVNALMNANLIDEYHFFINPTILGQGVSIFKILNTMELKLKTAIQFDCGIFVSCYTKNY
jgi:dihydrofolate reductase